MGAITGLILCIAITFQGAEGPAHYCATYEAISPIGPPCTLENYWMSSGCSTIVVQADGVRLLAGWSVDGLLLPEGRTGIYIYDVKRSPSDYWRCACEWWEHWPEYVLFPDGNPCERNVS